MLSQESSWVDIDTDKQKARWRVRSRSPLKQCWYWCAGRGLRVVTGNGKHLCWGERQGSGWEGSVLPLFKKEAKARGRSEFTVLYNGPQYPCIRCWESAGLGKLGIVRSNNHVLLLCRMQTVLSALPKNTNKNYDHQQKMCSLIRKIVLYNVVLYCNIKYLDQYFCMISCIFFLVCSMLLASNYFV